MKKYGGLGLGLETQILGLGLGLDKKVLFTSLQVGCSSCCPTNDVRALKRSVFVTVAIFITKTKTKTKMIAICLLKLELEYSEKLKLYKTVLIHG